MVATPLAYRLPLLRLPYEAFTAKRIQSGHEIESFQAPGGF